MTILGPGEFDADAPYPGLRPWSDSAEAERVMRIYQQLRPDLLYVSEEAAQWFAQGGCVLAAPFTLMRQSARSRIFDYQGRKVGVVFFGKPPRADSGLTAEGKSAPPSPDDLASFMDDALLEGRKLGSQVDLLIGVSPWGGLAEQAFLVKARGLYHILLGGGQGIGFAFASTADASATLWSRSGQEGMSVNLIRLFEWPEGGWTQWQPDVTFNAEQITLTPATPDDPETASLLPKY